MTVAGRMRRLGATALTLALALPGASGLAQQAPREDLEARLARVERLLEAEALVDIAVHLEKLQAEVRQLRGDVEVQTHALEDLRRRQRDLYQDIDRRLRALETGAGAAAQAPAPPATEPSPPPATAAAPQPGEPPGAPGTAAAPEPVVQSDPGAEQAAYQRAFELLREGSYDQAAEGFRALLAEYPAGRMADNAQYWLGEASYVTRDFAAAVVEFEKVLQHYPQSPKVPDAQLKTGYAYYELAEWEQARRVLTGLVERYPDTTAARLAENRLQRMRSEGR